MLGNCVDLAILHRTDRVYKKINMVNHPPHMCTLCVKSQSILRKTFATYYYFLGNFMQGTGYTALMFACKGGHLDTVIGLMEHGANSAIKNQVSLSVKREFLFYYL